MPTNYWSAPQGTPPSGSNGWQWPPPWTQPTPFPMPFPFPPGSGSSEPMPFPPLGRGLLEQNSREVRDLLSKASSVYRAGMTLDEFRSVMLPGGIESQRAPQWVHKAVDAVWDFFAWLFG